VGFTDSASGNLAFHVGDDAGTVQANRERLNRELSTLSGTAVRLRYMNQVHGNSVAVIDGLSEPGPTADALVSRTADLAVMVADCVPVVLVGSDAAGESLLGAVHAGRPGVQAGVIPAAVAQLRAGGAQNIKAWIGPSVCGRCYEVPEALRTAVADAVPAAHATTSWGTPALDLPAAVESQLAAAGVDYENVGVCTLEHASLYSHRRSVRDGEPEGRFIGFAVGGRQARAMDNSRYEQHG